MMAYYTIEGHIFSLLTQFSFQFLDILPTVLMKNQKIRGRRKGPLSDLRLQLAPLEWVRAE